ncbi:MAG: hypothetical protein HYZ14_14645 [Bacteroidetes bacterium]|nr:hypothetical protein [Bacteroidota bacterium]
MTKLRALVTDKKLNEVMFTLLILTFPFGSNYFSFSIGFMTVYPNLLVLAVLFISGVLRKDLPASWLEKYFLGFLILFSVVNLAYLPFVADKSYAIVDVRSTILMAMTGYVFLSQNVFLGFDKWRSTLAFAFRVVYAIVLIFGIFEYTTGWHFSGMITEHLIERGLVDLAVYSPLFLWDNPNNFMLYFVLMGFLLILLEPSRKMRNYLAFFVMALNLFFATVTLSRIGVPLSVFSFAVISILAGYETLRAVTKELRSKIYLVLFAVISLIIVYFSNEKFYGIPEARQMRETTSQPVYPEQHEAYLKSLPVADSTTVQSIAVTNDSAAVSNMRNSRDERKSLAKNGLVFFFESELVGIGPGQFRYRHDHGLIRYYAYGNNGPHFWFIEIMSQFGLIVFIPYIFLLGYLVAKVAGIVRKDLNYATFFLLALIGFGVGSLMPSAFLILDINWMFTAALVVLAANFSSMTKSAEHV